jgi:phosphohistidine phosphatase SixA
MKLRIVLVRHAQPKSATQSPDSSEFLSRDGRTMQKHVNGWLKERRFVPDEIWYSPAGRTTETAKIIGEDFDVQPKEEILLGTTLLGEMFDEQEVVNKLLEVPEETCLFLVTHAPQITRLANYLLSRHLPLGEPSHSSALIIDFRNEVGQGKGVIVKNLSGKEVIFEKNIKYPFEYK